MLNDSNLIVCICNTLLNIFCETLMQNFLWFIAAAHEKLYLSKCQSSIFCYSFSNISTEDQLYTEADLEESMSRIETINFHEEKTVNGIKFWCYHAGE